MGDNIYIYIYIKARARPIYYFYYLLLSADIRHFTKSVFAFITADK